MLSDLGSCLWSSMSEKSVVPEGKGVNVHSHVPQSSPFHLWILADPFAQASCVQGLFWFNLCYFACHIPAIFPSCMEHSPGSSWCGLGCAVLLFCWCENMPLTPLCLVCITKPWSACKYGESWTDVIKELVKSS